MTLTPELIYLDSNGQPILSMMSQSRRPLYKINELLSVADEPLLDDDRRNTYPYWLHQRRFKLSSPFLDECK